ncbi:MAG TPA: hypothetical protein VH142_16535 [Polyangiaceae bacterium]|jgi:hypothetical protein|nr:hypothetical protein [Polyangiaceae bacterium]
MRYSLVLPRSEQNDSAEVRKALDTAAELLDAGDGRGALQWMRRAAWAAAKTGQDTRALVLSKVAKNLQAAVETEGGEVIHDAPRPTDDGKQPRKGPSSRPKDRASSRSSQTKAVRETKPKSQRPTQRRDAMTVEDAARAASAQAPTSRARPITAPPVTVEAAMDLVVTVAPGEWEATDAAVLVGHRAMRVAVTAEKSGALVVRPLRAGEVAPKDSTVALLVSFEPGTPALTKTG